MLLFASIIDNTTNNHRMPSQDCKKIGTYNGQEQDTKARRKKICTSKMKLTYFNDNKGRNELTRLIFAVGDIDFENEDISHEEYTARRDSGGLPFGQVPTLTIDGHVYGQSCAIARYAAKRAKIYPDDELQALETDAIVDSWRDVLDLFYDCAFERDVIDGKLSMFPRPASQRWSKLNSFVVTALLEHVQQWNQMLSKNDGKFCKDIFPCWADLAVYDVIKTMENVLPKSQYQKVTSNTTSLVSMVKRIDEMDVIQKHLEKHPYKDISSFFTKPSLIQRVGESFLFPILKKVLLPTYLFVKRTFFFQATAQSKKLQHEEKKED